MQANSVYLALAPNIMRKTIQDLAGLKLGLDLIPPQIHEEILEFSNNYGLSGDIPGLTIAPYQRYAHNFLKYAETGNLAKLPDSLPQMRDELVALGMKEPSPYFRVIGFIPFIISAHSSVSSIVTDWEDLCRPEVCSAVAVPPEDTPIPTLFDNLMRQNYGEKAEYVIANRTAEYAPLDINKRIDSGDVLAAINLAAFSKTYREGNGQLVWPRSGAWLMPLMATVRQDAHEDTFEFISYLLSEKYQSYLSNTGNIVPVRKHIPWFPEMEQNDARLFWPGWDAFVKQGTP